MWFIGVEVEQETSAPPPKKKSWIRPCYNPSLSWSSKGNPLRLRVIQNVRVLLFQSFV